MIRNSKTQIHLCISFVITVCCSALFADNIVLQSKGVGTRALALGNSYVSIADDFTATYWNPGGLAFIPVRGLQAALDFTANTMDGVFDGNMDNARSNRVRLENAGLIRAVPTAQGGFAFALGFSSPYVLDNIYAFHGRNQYLGTRPDTSIYWDTITIGNKKDTVPVDVIKHGDIMKFDLRRNKIYGQLNLFSAAVGWQIARGLGFGVTLSLISGTENQNNRYRIYNNGDTLFDNSVEVIGRTYLGVDVRAGMLFTPFEYLKLGILINPPQFIRFEQYYQYKDLQYDDVFPQIFDIGSLKSSFSGSVGGTLTLPFLLFTVQGNVRAPVTAEENESNDRSYWKGGVSTGLEIPVRVISTFLRAGYSWSELDLAPYKVAWNSGGLSIEPQLQSTSNGIHTITGGIGFLLKDVCSIDLAYGYTINKYTVQFSEWKNSIQENHFQHRVELSFSIHY